MDPLTVGLILECGPEGADEQVCRELARRLRGDLTLRVATMSNKAILKAECGVATAALIRAECARVVIVWDLFPPWRDRPPCRRDDRDAIFASIDAAQVPRATVHLVCIAEEL